MRVDLPPRVGSMMFRVESALHCLADEGADTSFSLLIKNRELRTMRGKKKEKI